MTDNKINLVDNKVYLFGANEDYNLGKHRAVLKMCSKVLQNGSYIYNFKLQGDWKLHY